MPIETCLVFADMIGSTKLWADALGRRGNIEQTWGLVCDLQSLIIKVLRKYGGQFVKGVGDELIFRFEDCSLALEATRQAQKALKEDKHYKRSKFRFVIHYTKDKVIPGDYDLSDNEPFLKAVREDATSRSNPKSSDLFGHHMNYAARCIGVVTKRGIYLTDTVMHPDTLSLDWPITVSGAKGLGELIYLRQIKEKEPENKFATVAAYKTKALVSIPQDSPTSEWVFNAGKKLMDRASAGKDPRDSNQDKTKGSALSTRDLAAHLFLVFHTVDYIGPVPPEDQGPTPGGDGENPGSDEERIKPRSFFRFECLDQERLEKILLSRIAKRIFNAGNSDKRSKKKVNSITRFIRSAGQNTWAEWGDTRLSADDMVKPLLYVEIQPTDVDEIDLYAAKLRNSSDMEAIEIGRLWGKPSVYALCKWKSPKPKYCVILQKMTSQMFGNGKPGKGADIHVWKVCHAKATQGVWPE